MPRARRPLVFLGAIVLALTGIILISQWRAAHAVDLIPWRKDLPEAEAEAKAQHKQVFAYFTATWCGPCQEMKRTTWSDNTVGRAMESRFVPVKIDIDENRSLAIAYGIDGVPTFIALSEMGNVVRQATGYMDAKEMENWLEH
jgi:thiol:disulfide interchange protein